MKKNALKQDAYYVPEIKKLRLLLTLSAILYTFNLHPILGDFNGIIFGFSFPALYIISGYLVLREDDDIEKRILRAVKRTAICFFVMLAVFLLLSLLVDKNTTLELIVRKRFWADVILLNIWTLPVGSTIWYVQALLYAYIIIYVIYKLKLLRFDIYIAAFCLIITLLTGEFASVIGFRFLRHPYLAGNFLTRALPYILIGCFIHRKKRLFLKLKKKHYFLIISGGAVLAFVEYMILFVTGKNIYSGHMLGMGVVAVGICLNAFFTTKMKLRSELLGGLSRHELAIPYFVCSPIYTFIIMILKASPFTDLANATSHFIGVLTPLLSFLVLFIYAFFAGI